MITNLLLATGLAMTAAGPSAGDDDRQVVRAADIPLSSTSTPLQQPARPAEPARRETGAATRRLRPIAPPALPTSRLSAVPLEDSDVPPLEAPRPSGAEASQADSVPGAGAARAPLLEPPAGGVTDSATGPEGALELAPPLETPVPLAEPPSGATPAARPGLSLEVMDEDGTAPPPLQGLDAMPDARGSALPDDSVDFDDDASERDRRPAPPRRRGLLGRVLGRPEPTPPRAEASDPVSEDAAEADLMLQRKIDREIRRIVGRHLRGVDVVVRGRVIYIRADADRLWNRRGVRRDIEALPILAGYDARIRVE